MINFGALSITRRLTISLMIIIVFISTIGIVVSYLIGKQYVLNTVEQQANERVVFISRILEVPVWNFSVGEIEKVAQAQIESTLVSNIRIVDSSGMVLFSGGEAHEAATVVRTSKILHAGQEIGYVEITLAADYPLEIGRQFLLLTAVVLLINIAGLMVAVIFLMPAFIGKPVAQITDIARRYGSGEYDIPEEPSTAEEFRPIISALDKMANQIQSQFLELKTAEQNFRNSLDDSPLGVRIVTGDGKLLYANKAILDIYGYSSIEELRIIPAKERYTPQSYAEQKQRIKLRRLGETVPSSYEINIVRKDGEIRYLQAYRKEVIWDGETRFQTIYQDITERKQAEEDTKRSIEFFRAIFNSTADIILVIDVHDFTIVRANDAFLQQYGVREEQIIGKTCYQITHHRSDPCIPPEDSCPLQDTVITGKHSVAEHVHYTKDNEKVYVEVSTSPIKDEGGKVIQVVHVSRDITERKKMQEQLMAQDRLSSIGELTAGIAHEINNPLTGVIGFSDLLLGRDVPADIREDLEIINKEAKRTAGIVKNLLTFARKHPQEKKSTSINEVITSVIELRAYEQKVNNIQVNTQLAPELPEVMGNAFDLRQVFLNIVINAEYFMTEAYGRGTLTITTEQDGDIIRASFADDGPGIAKEVGKGTGLGLSICHGIITEHGGKIHAESKLGEGATFIIELPITR